MKPFIDVIFALLPLALIALPITALLILRGVLSATAKISTSHKQQTQETTHDNSF